WRAGVAGRPTAPQWRTRRLSSRAPPRRRPRYQRAWAGPRVRRFDVFAGGSSRRQCVLWRTHGLQLSAGPYDALRCQWQLPERLPVRVGYHTRDLLPRWDVLGDHQRQSLRDRIVLRRRGVLPVGSHGSEFRRLSGGVLRLVAQPEPDAGVVVPEYEHVELHAPGGWFGHL